MNGANLPAPRPGRLLGCSGPASGVWGGDEVCRRLVDLLTEVEELFSKARPGELGGASFHRSFSQDLL